MNKMNKKGFTIVELVIVIAVIAILAGVLIPTFSNVIDKANESKALQEVKNAYTATLADEMATPGTEGDTITNALKASTDGIFVGHNDKIIKIAKDGAITVVANGTAGYKVDNGKIAVGAPTK